MTVFAQSEVTSIQFDGSKLKARHCISNPVTQEASCREKSFSSPEEVRSFLLSQPASKMSLDKRLSMDFLKSTKTTQKTTTKKRTKKRSHRRKPSTKSSHQRKPSKRSGIKRR